MWAEALAGAKVSRVYAGACVRACVLEGVWALKQGERLEEGEEMLSGKSGEEKTEDGGRCGSCRWEEQYGRRRLVRCTDGLLQTPSADGA